VSRVSRIRALAKIPQ